jgi:hypothetical protein
MPPVKVDLDAGTRTQGRPTGLLRGAPLLYPALIGLLAVFALAPLTYPGSFQTHSGFNAVYNLMDLDAHLGMSLAWAPTFGSGFDLLRMDGSFPYFVGTVFHLLGFSFDGSIKLVYAIGFLLSGWGMFALARRIFLHDGAGLLAGVVYLYFPYHLADVYVRGALGEATEWALFPLALTAILQLRGLRSPALRHYLSVILLFALIVLTKPGLALLFALASAAASLLLRSNRSAQALPREWTVGLGVLLGGSLSLAPFLLNQAIGGSYSFTSAYVYPFQFLTASWGKASPTGSYLDQFPFQLGIAAIGLTILALALVLRPSGPSSAVDGKPRIVLFAVMASIAGMVLMTPLAAPLWTISGATYLVEFPFQLLPFVGLGLSIAAGSVAASDARLSQTPMLAALVVIPILAVYPYLAPEFLDFAPTHPALARFNQGEIALLDAKIVRPPGILRHGATLELDLEWQPLRQVNHDYTVFVHVVDENGKEWGGEDTKPQNGALPTLQWNVGRVISDAHTVQIDLAGPPQGYHLEVGLYEARSGERAITETGATEIRIEENPE